MAQDIDSLDVVALHDCPDQRDQVSDLLLGRVVLWIFVVVAADLNGNRAQVGVEARPVEEVLQQGMQLGFVVTELVQGAHEILPPLPVPDVVVPAFGTMVPVTSTRRPT